MQPAQHPVEGHPFHLRVAVAVEVDNVRLLGEALEGNGGHVVAGHLRIVPVALDKALEARARRFHAEQLWTPRILMKPLDEGARASLTRRRADFKDRVDGGRAGYRADDGLALVTEYRGRDGGVVVSGWN